MIRLALIMHEPLASAFASCAEHVLGEKPDLFVFDIQADECTDTAVDRLLGQLQTQAPDSPATLILCDLYGATPLMWHVESSKLCKIKGRALIY